MAVQSPTARTSRPRPRRSGGWGGLVFCLALIAAGIFVGPQLLERVRENQDHNRRNAAGRDQVETRYEIQGASAAQPAPAQAAPAEQAPIAAVPKPEPVAVPEAPPSADFVRLTKEAKTKLDAGEYEAAKAIYLKATGLGGSAGAIGRAQAGADACEVFSRLVEGVKVSVEAEAGNLYKVTLKNGAAPFRAKVTEAGAGQVKIQKDGIASLHDRGEIAAMEPIRQADRDREMRDRLTADKLKAEREGLAYYLLAIEARKSNFRKDEAELLQEALALDPELEKSVMEHHARRLLKEAAWFCSVGDAARGEKKFAELAAKFPGTKAAEVAAEIQADAERRRIAAIELKVAAEAQKRRAEEEKRARAEEERRRKEAAAAATKPAQAGPGEDAREGGDRSFEGDVDGKDKEAIAQANAAFRQGADLAQEGKTTSSVKRSNECYKLAVGAFEKAQALYAQALKKEPGSADLQNRLQECTMQLYWCRKLQRLG